jgi:hypothetical protein
MEAAQAVPHPGHEMGKCRAPAGDAAHLPHGEEARVRGGQASCGQTEVLRRHAPCALDFTHPRDRNKEPCRQMERERPREPHPVQPALQRSNLCFAVLRLKFGLVTVGDRRTGQRQPFVCDLCSGDL